MLEMGRDRSVLRRKAIVLALPDFSGTRGYHWFNRDDHPRFEYYSLPGFSKIKDNRVFVKIFSNSVSREGLDNRKPVFFGVALDRSAYISRLFTNLRRFNSFRKRLSGYLYKLF